MEGGSLPGLRSIEQSKSRCEEEFRPDLLKTTKEKLDKISEGTLASENWRDFDKWIHIGLHRFKRDGVATNTREINPWQRREVGGICAKEPVSPRGANTTSVPLTPIPRALSSLLQLSNPSPSSMFITSVLKASGGRSFTAESSPYLESAEIVSRNFTAVAFHFTGLDLSLRPKARIGPGTSSFKMS
ncbi:hypothetical protein BASA83_011642 [Batrachochytrium salamandrivorans]|nr:hypothetical protein BASA83_011642 [Batrachochytrium salamandrivorans]